MRRPRHRLQVSTFPFLAVLLGAMGSLIFLLLIMDRRAKIVARNKVRDYQESRLAEARRADQERRAAWEGKRDRLHALLQEEERALIGALQAAHHDLGTLTRRAEAHSARRRELHDAIARHEQALAGAKKSLDERQRTLMQSSHLEETTRTELARLTRELLDLQRAADDLKRLKRRQQPAYSLVPYRGRQGDSRLPIYVECTQGGLLFLSDGLRVAGPDLDVPAFRAEIERRHGPLAKERRNDNPFRTPADDQPYVLFLVRPDGIPSYYRAQAALHGYDIDFGYEVVDAEWKLEVPTAQQLAQLIAEEKQTPAFRAAGSTAPAKTGTARAGQDAGPVRNAALGSPAPAEAGTVPSPGANGPAENPTQPGPPATPPVAPAPPPQPDDGSAIGRLAPPQPAKERKTAAAAATPTLSREFIITIACYGEGVVVNPSGASFHWTKAADPRAVDQAVVKAVKDLSARRQATVPAGGVPYRVVLKFVVHPEGLRSMYRVYPLLERLRLPMVRENVEE